MLYVEQAVAGFHRCASIIGTVVRELCSDTHALVANVRSLLIAAMAVATLLRRSV